MTITIGFNGEWHVITLLDGALMCRMNEVPEYPMGWDYTGDITEYKQIPELYEGICPKCIKRCLAHYMRDEERETVDPWDAEHKDVPGVDPGVPDPELEALLDEEGSK